MIQQIEKLLRRWGLISAFDKDDVLNAEIEDQARQNEKVVGRLHQSFSRRFAVNEKLQHSIMIAKERTNSFEQFEKLMTGHTND